MADRNASPARARRGRAATYRGARAALSRELPEELRDADLHLGAECVRRAHAARAALGARAVAQVLGRPFEERLRRLEEALGEADAARGHVEQVDGRKRRVR